MNPVLLAVGGPHSVGKVGVFHHHPTSGHAILHAGCMQFEENTLRKTKLAHGQDSFLRSVWREYDQVGSLHYSPPYYIIKQAILCQSDTPPLLPWHLYDVCRSVQMAGDRM